MAIKASGVAVGTTAVAVYSRAGNALRIKNTGTQSAYIGASDVTSATGWEIPAGTTLELPAGTGGNENDIYAIAAAGQSTTLQVLALR